MARLNTMLRRTILLLAMLLAFGASRAVLAQEPTKDQAAHVEKKEGESAKAGETHGEASTPHDPNVMEVQAPLAIWTLVLFLCLLIVLGKFAWKPLMKSLEEREAHLEHVLRDSEKARDEAEALAAQHRKELATAADQVRALIEEARKEAMVAANSIIQKAQSEAEESRKRAEREIAGAKDQALMDIWSQTADLAVSVAGKVLGKELGESDHRRLVEMAMGELPANGQEGSRS
jgi:F-type H+-transporting ATPase subunit b